MTRRPARRFLDAIPKILRNDAQRGHLDRDPLLGRTQAHDALARIGIPDLAAAVPHHLANVERIVQDPEPLLGRAVDGRPGPSPRPLSPARVWWRHGLLVELMCDRLRRQAPVVIREDPQHAGGLRRINDSAVANDLPRVVKDRLGSIPIRAAAGGEPSADLPEHPAPGLLPKIFEKNLVLPARDGGEEVAGLFGKVRAGRHRVDLDAPESQPLQRVVHLPLITPKAVLRFHEDRLELACFRGGHQGHVSRSLIGSPADLLIGILADDLALEPRCGIAT